MPTQRRDDDVPVVVFDPTVEISPFTLFRRMREGRPTRLVDLRPDGGERTLAGAEGPPADPAALATAELVVVFDDDGDRAVATAREWQAAGLGNVRALFGGLDLYQFSLDPEVVGEETFLVVGGG